MLQSIPTHVICYAIFREDIPLGDGELCFDLIDAKQDRGAAGDLKSPVSTRQMNSNTDGMNGE
jgi:hypothetical protein